MAAHHIISVYHSRSDWKLGHICFAALALPDSDESFNRKIFFSEKTDDSEFRSAFLEQLSLGGENGIVEAFKLFWAEPTENPDSLAFIFKYIFVAVQ